MLCNIRLSYEAGRIYKLCGQFATCQDRGIESGFACCLKFVLMKQRVTEHSGFRRKKIFSQQRVSEIIRFVKKITSRCDLVKTS